MKLIDGDALKKAISNHPLIDFTDDDLFKLIDNAPTVEYPFYAEAYQTGYEEGIGDLNNAINMIKSVCKEHNACVECPMNRNCNEHPADWKEAEGGTENE